MKKKEIKILYLYPDILELYGDYGNIQVLRYRLEQRNIQCSITSYSIGDVPPNFSDFDIVFAGGGADQEQGILANDFMNLKENIQNAINSGVFFLLICGAYQLFGKYYKDADGNEIPGLNIFNYYTIANPDKKQRCIGNAIIETNEGEKVIGFVNHGGQTYGVDNSFGKVLYGYGNTFENREEGFQSSNVIATYFHGPLLSKNPNIADHIISYALNRKYGESNFKNIDNSFESKCREILINRFLGENNGKI